MSRTWRVRLTAQAEQHVETIMQAIEALMDGPETLGTTAREELAPGIHTLHTARHGRKARHFVVFRVANDQGLEVLRLLHDSMDLARHLPKVDDLPHGLVRMSRICRISAQLLSRICHNAAHDHKTWLDLAAPRLAVSDL